MIDGPDPLLTRIEAARFLGYHSSSMKGWDADPTKPQPVYVPGRARPFYRRSDLVAYAEAERYDRQA